MAKTVSGELARRRAQLATLDKEAAGPLGAMRRSQIRALRADIIAEVDALEVALRLPRGPELSSVASATH